VIGEAVKKLPHEARAMCPEIEWRKIAGSRDFVAHTYFGIDREIVWNVVREKVPQLLDAMRTAEAR
jgi:uncharacterized protein with HEPN domain